MKEKRKHLVMACLLVSVLLVGVILVEGCKKSESRTPIDEGGAKWVCPDHPDIVESRPVKCRRCGRDLVPLEAEKEVEKVE